MAHIVFQDERYNQPKLTACAEMENETRSTHLNHNSSCGIIYPLWDACNQHICKSKKNYKKNPGHTFI